MQRIKEGRTRRLSSWPQQLTTRERTVVRLLAEGRAQTEIAKQLGVSVRTIEKHVQHARTKTGTQSAFDLAVKVGRGEIRIDGDD